MFKIISILSLAVLIFITDSFSQSNNNALLYAQNNWQVTDTMPFIPSGKYASSDWTQIADDFTVTSDWTIDQIIVNCMDLITELVKGFNIYIYSNNNGIPGTLVYSAETQSYSTSFVYYDIDKVTITLTNPATLIPGGYFISVQSNTDYWYWSQANGSYGYPAKIRSINSAYWHPLNSSFGDVLTDMYFELYGSTAVPTGVEIELTSPSTFSLEQNYPNPFNPSTKISWQSPVAGYQTLKVYDVLGNEVATLVDEYKSAGVYEVTFDASKLSSGIYFYKLQAGNFVETKKLVLLK